MAQFFLRQLLESCKVFRYLRRKLLRILASVLKEVVARLRSDGEPGRHRQPDPCHLRQACTFASQQFALLAGSIRFSCAKKIDVFHRSPSVLVLGLLNKFVGAPILEAFLDHYLFVLLRTQLREICNRRKLL